jgi:Tol biopolymer transport system component
MRRISLAAFIMLCLAACSASGAPSPSASAGESEAPNPSPSASEAPAPTASPSESPDEPEGFTGHPGAGMALTGFPDPATGRSQIFVVGPDGGLRQVTGLSGELTGSFATWSPDGTQLSFSDSKVGSGLLYGQVAVVNADGSNERMLGEGRDHQWSPDGSRILYWESDPVGDGETSMLVLDVASGAVTEIGLGAMPRWLPDGERISFTRWITNPDGSMGSALYVMPVAGGEAQEIAPETEAYWSPDGTAVLLVHEGVVSIAATDFSGSRELVNGFGPVWSPDGQSVLVAYDHDQDANPVLALVDLDGQAVWSGASGSRPTWSPDGTRLAVEVYDPEMPKVQVLDASSGEILWETEGMQPAWPPAP